MIFLVELISSSFCS